MIAQYFFRLRTKFIPYLDGIGAFQIAHCRWIENSLTSETAG